MNFGYNRKITFCSSSCEQRNYRYKACLSTLIHDASWDFEVIFDLSKWSYTRPLQLDYLTRPALLKKHPARDILVKSSS